MRVFAALGLAAYVGRWPLVPYILIGKWLGRETTHFFDWLVIVGIFAGATYFCFWLYRRLVARHENRVAPDPFDAGRHGKQGVTVATDAPGRAGGHD